jgi:hypothetical protein
MLSVYIYVQPRKEHFEVKPAMKWAPGMKSEGLQHVVLRGLIMEIVFIKRFNHL